MDLSGRWEFSFDRTLNGQLSPTTVPLELILIQTDATQVVGRFVFPADDVSRFRGQLTTTPQGTLLCLHQHDEASGYQALYIARVEDPDRVGGIFTDLAGPEGDFRLKRIR